MTILGNEMTVIETQLVQRDFDKRWELLWKVLDHENAYSFKNELGVYTTLTPEKWITAKVYDFIFEVEK